MQNAIPADGGPVLFGLPNNPPVFTGQTGYTSSQRGQYAQNTPGVSEVSIATTDTGTTYMAYADGGNVSVMRLDGDTWTPLSDGRFSSSGYVDMAVSPDGTPYVSFVQGSDSDLTILKWNGSSWEDVASSSLSHATTFWSQLAFGPDGTPYLAYVATGSSALNVMQFVNNAWTNVGAADIGTIGTGGFDLTIGQSGTPYVVHSLPGDSGALDILAFDNGTWRSLGAPSPKPHISSGPQLVEDHDGTVYLTYRDENSSLVVARFDGTQWDRSPTEALPVSLSSAFGLLVGNDGNIHLGALGGVGYPAPVEVLTFDGTDWKRAGGEELLTVGGSAMAMRADGTVLVTLRDPENSSKLALREYGETFSATGSTTATSLGGFTFTDTENDPISFSVTGGKDAALFVTRDGEVRFERTPAAGTYEVQVTVSDGFNDITRKVVVTVATPQTNHAPELDVSASPALADVGVGAGAPSGAVGTLVSALAGGGSDADGNALGIALTGKADNASVYYSLNDGDTWTAVASLGESSALLLAPSARVYVSADKAGTLTDALRFKTWDQSQGTNGATNVDTRYDPVIERFNTGNHNAADFVLSGSIAFIADSQNTAAGLTIVDLSDPANPVGLSTLSLESAYEVAVQGNYAYVAMHTGLAIVDISNLANPSLVHTITMPRASGVLIDGNLAHVTAISGGLKIFDISDPLSPSSLGAVLMGGDPLHESVLRDGLLYVVDRNSGVHIFDVTNPLNPIRLSEAQTSNFRANDVALKDDIAYTAALDKGLAIIDVSSPNHPVVSGYLRTGTENATSVTRDDNLLYVGIEGRGIRVYDITDPAMPISVRFIDTQGGAGTSVIDGGHLYTVSGNRLTVVQLDNDGAFSANTDSISQTVMPNIAPIFDEQKYQQTVIDPAIGTEAQGNLPLVTSSDGTLYLAYQNELGVVVTQKGPNSETWEALPADEFEGARDVQLATDAEGVLYVTFVQSVPDQTDPDWIGRATVMKLQDGVWKTVGGEWIDVAYPEMPRLVPAADGTLYLAYNHAGNLEMRKFADGAWGLLENDPVPGLSMPNYDIVIGNDGHPYIAFADNTANNHLKVMRHDGNGWVEIVNPELTQVAARTFTIASGANGIYVAYGQDSGHFGNDIYVQHFDGTRWTTLSSPRNDVKVDGNTLLGSTPLPYDLVVGDDGAVYLAASQNRSASDFYVLRYSGDKWEAISSSINGANLTSLVLGENGQVYVSAMDEVTRFPQVQELNPIAQATALTTGTTVNLGLSDPDGDPLTYTISGGTHQALFEITPDGIRFIEKPAAAGTYSVQVTVDDGVNQVVRTVSVTVTVPPNSAPVLDTSASPKLPDAELGGLAPEGAVGVTVSDLLGDSVSDIDDNPVGMVVTGVNGGTLYYSQNGGTTWTAVTGTIDAKQALALRADVRIYFEAAPDSTGNISDALTFRAWDGTDGTTGSRLNVSGTPAVLNQKTVNSHGSVLVAEDRILSFGASGIEVLNSSLGFASSMSGGSVSGLLMGATSGSQAYFLRKNPFQENPPASITQVSLEDSSNQVVGQPLSLQTRFPSDAVFSGFAAYGNTLLVASTGYGVLELSLDDAGVPSVGNFIYQGASTAVTLDDTRIVIGVGSSGLQVRDRTDNSTHYLAFSSLQDLGPASAHDLFLKGDHVYVVTQQGSLLIADLSNLDALAWETKVDLPGNALKVFVIGDRAFVTTQNNVQVIDVSDPSAPVLGEALDIAGVTGIAQIGDELVITTGNAVRTVSTGMLPGSVSVDTDTISVDVADTIAPTLTLPADNDAHLRGEDLTIGSTEAGTVYLVKTGAHTGTPTAAELVELLQEGSAVSMAVSNGSAVFDTDTLLGDYLVFGVDAAGNVSSGAGNTVTIRTVPTLSVSEENLSFTEGDTPITVAPDLVLADDDAADTGLSAAHVMLLPSPLLVGGVPIDNIDAGESLVLVANPATMGSLTGSYSADESTLTITGSGTLAQWQAALRAVQYSNTSKNPAESRSLKIIVVDTDGKTSADETVIVDITPVDDLPVISGVPSRAETVNVGTATKWATITVEDPDSTTLTVTLTASNGTIGGMTPVDGVYVLQGNADHINEALAELTFTLLQAGTGSVSLSISDGTDREPVVATYSFASPVVVTPPVVPTTPVDGVPVQIGTGNDGQQQITVPVVTPDRNEDTSTPNGRLADIAVVKNSAGVALLNLGLPVGTGLTTNGPANTVSGTNAQSVLDGRITSASGSAEQKASAQAFLNSLPSDTQVVVQTVTVTAQSNNGGPLVVSAANTQDGHKTAVVVDTRSLPAGTLIDLENIDFAVIVGNARVTGGAGANIAYGDNEDQFIVLGEGDDILHGGGGDDTVGSLRGNDQVFGDAGNDVVYGGSGNDTLSGGAGNDAMNGGFGFDTALQSGIRTDYSLKIENGSVVLTHLRSGETDRFTDVERITFDSGKAIVIAHEASDVANLRAQYANDELIELNLTRAIIGTEGNDVITPELGVGRNIDLGAGQDVVKLAGGRDGVHLDVEAGQIVDLTRLEDGAMLSLKNVELLEFSNGDVTVLAQTNDQAILGRAYELLLGRNVDVEGFQFWAEALNAGVSLQSVLQSIVTSQEAAAMYKLANGNFIEQLYVQGLDRASDAAGKGYWADALAAGVSRATVLEGFAGSAEAIEVIGSTIDVNTVS